MNTSIFIDPYALINPKLEDGEEAYLLFIETLLDWEGVFRHEKAVTYLHSEIITTLFELEAYPMHETLKKSNSTFNINHIPIDSVNKILTAFINKSITFDCQIEYSKLKISPSHLLKEKHKQIDIILDKIYGYLLLNNSILSQGILSPYFVENSINVTADINYAIIDTDSDFPISKADEIPIFKEFASSMERCSLTELPITDLEPRRKKIKLSGDHHGNKLLKKFAKKLFKSPYVISVINNIAFEPEARHIIHKIYKDGKIDIVLSSTDAGYGMVIETTGENQSQTERISKIIFEQFNDKQ